MVVRGDVGGGDRISTPGGVIKAGQTQTSSILKSCSEISGHDCRFGEPKDLTFQKEHSRTAPADVCSEYVDMDQDLASLYTLNEVQIGTISILKAGLDQINWEPLIGLLEELAVSGTVSRQKLHDCAAKVIRRILGADLELQVLQQFHSDPSKGEVVMIESLICCYVNELSMKKSQRIRNQKTFCDELSNERSLKRNVPSKEKKGYQPSYQKTTESFRRKQRGKCPATSSNHVKKRPIRQYTRNENKVSSKTSQHLAQAELNSVHEVNSPSVIKRAEKYGTIDNWYNNKNVNTLTDCEIPEVVSLRAPVGVTKGRKGRRNEARSQPSVNKKIKGDVWDLVETETAVKAYEGRKDNISGSAKAQKAVEAVSGSVRRLEVVPKRVTELDIGADLCHDVDSISSVSKTTDDPFFELYNDKTGSDDEGNFWKDMAWLDTDHSIADMEVTSDNTGFLMTETRGLTLNDPVHYRYEQSDGTFRRAVVLRDFLSRANHQRACVRRRSLDRKRISRVDSVFDSGSGEVNIFKLNAERESDSLYNKTTITELDDEPREPLLRLPQSFSSVIVSSNEMKDVPSNDSLIALRISKELMTVLKEQFVRNRIDKLNYCCISDENTNPPFPDLENIRIDSGAIMKRLNLISTMTILVLISSLLTSVIFVFSTDNNYVQKSTIDFLSRVLCGWCR